MADGDGHFGPDTLDKLHEKFRQSGTEGGACLTGHQAAFSKHNGQVTCNYRFQAWKQAQDHKGINAQLHSYKNKLIPGGIKTSAWKKKVKDYWTYLPKPRPGDWDVTGPLQPIVRKSWGKTSTVTVPATMNFTQETWPYWNNAHHLIPKGTLQSKILDEEQRVCNLIQKALMTAQYNVNHKINMLFIPQDGRVAEILDMPRHLQLRDKDAKGLSAQCADHPIYSAMACTVRLGLDSVMDNYRKLVDQAIKDVKGTHKQPKPNLDKTKLERLSKKLLKMLLGASGDGLIAAGQSIDALASAVG